MRKTHLQNSLELQARNSRANLQPEEKDISKLDKEITKLYPTTSSHRSVAVMLADTQFDEVISLIALGQFPASFLVMHSITEDAALRLLPRNLKIKENHLVVFDLLKRRTLSDIAPYYRDLGVWTAADVTFTKKLVSLRNGITHRNFELLEKHVKRKDSYRKMGSFAFDLESSVVACAHCIDLCIKAFKPNKRKAHNNQIKKEQG